MHFSPFLWPFAPPPTQLPFAVYTPVQLNHCYHGKLCTFVLWRTNPWNNALLEACRVVVSKSLLGCRKGLSYVKCRTDRSNRTNRSPVRTSGINLKHLKPEIYLDVIQRQLILDRKQFISSTKNWKKFNVQYTSNYFILGAFRKIAKSAYWLRLFCLTFCPSAWTTRLLLERFFVKIDIWVFLENQSRKCNFHLNLARIRVTLLYFTLLYFTLLYFTLLYFTLLYHKRW
jgi:hypothetical protein